MNLLYICLISAQIRNDLQPQNEYIKTLTWKICAKRRNMALTRSDCEALFAKLNYPNKVRLESFSIEPFTKVTLGYLGSHLRLLLNASNGHTTSLFVKTVAPNMGMVKCFEDIPLYEKELFVYRFIEQAAREVPDHNIDTSVVPKLLLDKTLPNGEKVMVFEDLQRQGYSVAKEIKIGDAEICAGLKALAKFHTISIVWELCGKKSLRKQCEDEGRNNLHVFFERDNKHSSGFKYFMASQAGAIQLANVFHPENQEYTEKIKNSSEWYLDILNDDNPWRKVLCQGDLWCYNLLFNHSGKGEIGAKVLDFQLCRYAPPAHDVSMLVYMATEQRIRKKHILKFYDCYYTSLGDELKIHGLDISKVLPRNEFDQTCKIYMEVAKFIWLMYRQTSQQSQENTEYMMSHYDYMLNAVVGPGRSEFVQRLLKIDAGYGPGIKVIFEEYLDSLKFTPISLEEVYMVIGRKLMILYGEILDFDIVEYKCSQVENGVYHVSIGVEVCITPKNSELVKMKYSAKMVENSRLNPENLEKMAVFEFDEIIDKVIS